MEKLNLVVWKSLGKQSSASLICDFGKHFSDEVIGFNHQFQVLILQIMEVKNGAVYALEFRMQSPSVSQSHRCLAYDTWAQKTVMPTTIMLNLRLRTGTLQTIV